MPTKSLMPSVIPVERIARAIYLIRGEKVMLDYDLAELYGVQTIARYLRQNPPVYASLEGHP